MKRSAFSIQSKTEMLQIVRTVWPLLPRDRPTHLLGIGDVESIRSSVPYGVDTFDSCWPTRLGRHGTALTRAGQLKIGQSIYREDYRPLDERCDGLVCRRYSRAYLHHLWKAREPLVHSLLTLHNLKFMCDIMAELREDIRHDRI